MKLVREKSKEQANNSPIVNKVITMLRNNQIKVHSTQSWQPSTFAPYLMVNIAVTAPVDESGLRFVPSGVLEGLASIKRMNKNFLYEIYFNPKTPRLIIIQIKEFENMRESTMSQQENVRPVVAKVNPLKRAEKQQIH